MSSGTLKYWGGLQRVAATIAGLAPPHRVYHETHFGGGAVLFALNPGRGAAEYVNDRWEHLTWFWRTLQDPDLFAPFCRMVEATPVSEPEFRRACSVLDVPVPDHAEGKVWAAWAVFVACRQSRAGDTRTFHPFTVERLRRGTGEQASAWWSAVEGLAEARQRLSTVQVSCRDACQSLVEVDGRDTFHFLDPPWMIETRAAPNQYRVECGRQHHLNLLGTLPKLRGRWMIAGRRSSLYDGWAGRYGFLRTDLDVPADAAGGRAKGRAVTCLWTNYDPSDILGLPPARTGRGSRGARIEVSSYAPPSSPSPGRSTRGGRT